MQGPSSLRAALLLGAGASCFAGFPTVDSFFGRAWHERGGMLDELCSQLARRISIHEGTKDHVNWPTFNAEKLFGWLEILNNAHKIQSINGGAQAVTISSPRGWSERADELMSKLKREIVRVYGTEPDSKTLQNAPHNDLFKFLDTLIPQDASLDVFTTNYDRFLEKLFEHWEGGNRPLYKQVRICTGFSLDRPGQWRPDLFEEKPTSGVRLIRLAKLHGSITWKKDPATGRIVDTSWAGATDYDILLYFGYKSVPEDEPFLTLHELLKSTLLECDFLIAIGFRFGDPYIYELFDLALRANPRLKLICCLTRVPESGSPISRMTQQFPQRVHLLTNARGNPVPLGNQDFLESLRQLLTQTSPT